MPVKPENITITQRYILIGEDHEGDYTFRGVIFEKYEDSFSDLLKNKSQITIWYEGDSPGGSKSFKNFLADFRKKYNIPVTTRSWESNRPKPNRIEAIASVILGASYEQYIRDLQGELTGNQTLLDAFIKSSQHKSYWEFGGKAAWTKKEVREALSIGSIKSDVLIELEKPNSATEQTVKRLYDGEYAMRNKYFEYDKKDKVTQRVYSFNAERDKILAYNMKVYGGIFLAGDGHVVDVKPFL